MKLANERPLKAKTKMKAGSLFALCSFLRSCRLRRWSARPLSRPTLTSPSDTDCTKKGGKFPKQEEVKEGKFSSPLLRPAPHSLGYRLGKVQRAPSIGKTKRGELRTRVLP